MPDGILGIRVVTIGGGTGQYQVLVGLVQRLINITAVPSVFDNGGSSGVFRDRYGVLPQGDIRRCLLALASYKDRFTTEDLLDLRDMLEMRFEEDGHSFGNFALLASIRTKKSQIEGIRFLGRLLKIRGQVLPVSLDKAHLCAELCDGSHIEGETAIDRRSINDDRVIRKVWLSPKAIICSETIEAIVNADIIIFCPGDFWTSLVPNLLVEGVADAIARSKGQVALVTNLMTKWAETRNYDVPRFLKELKRYGFGRDKLDAVLVNNAPIPTHLLEYYKAKDKSEPITLTGDKWAEARQYTKRIIAQDFLERTEESVRERLIRHDSAKLAEAIVNLKL